MESKLSIDTTKHILNTSGIENYSDHEMDMVRLGIGLYVGSKKPYNSTVASLIISGLISFNFVYKYSTSLEERVTP